MKKPTAHNTLKTITAGATTGATVNLGIQLSTGVIDPVSITLTAVAAVLVGIVLAEDITRLLRSGLQRLARARMTGTRFRRRHGDPARWDDDEYEAYFAITARRTRPTNIKPAA